MLCRLDLRRVGWQKQQVDVVWHTQALRAVPASAIQHQYDLLDGTGPHLQGKGGQLGLEKENAGRGR